MNVGKKGQIWLKRTDVSFFVFRFVEYGMFSHTGTVRYHMVSVMVETG